MPIKKIAIIDTAQTTWIVPDDWDNSTNSIELIGSGGSTQDALASPTGQCNGAGGGAYAKLTNFALTPGQTVYINVGNYLTTKDTWINKTTASAPTVVANGALAKGGTNGTITVAGTGGQSAQCIGNTVFSGGNGGVGLYNANTNGGGGGGGAAGPGGVGKNGGNGQSSSTGDNAGGGGGGSGGGLSTAGAAGSAGTPGIAGLSYGGYTLGGGAGGSGSVSPNIDEYEIRGTPGIDLGTAELSGTPRSVFISSQPWFGSGGGGGGCSGTTTFGAFPAGPGGSGGTFGGGGGGCRSFTQDIGNGPEFIQAGGNNGSNGIIFITYGTETRTPKKLAFTESTTWTVPDDWDNSANSIECIGGGGGGGVTGLLAGGGGAGGAYSRINNLYVGKRQAFDIIVGRGGTASGDTFDPLFPAGETKLLEKDAVSYPEDPLYVIYPVGAEAGNPGIGAGGAPVTFYNGLYGTAYYQAYCSQIQFLGGKGGDTDPVTWAGGGGGGAGGPLGPGKAGANGDPAAAGDDGGGGGGGAGGLSSTAGTVGGTAGGAGGQGPAGTGSGASGSGATPGAAGTLGGGGGGGDQLSAGGSGGSSTNLGTSTLGVTYGSGGGGGGGGGGAGDGQFTAPRGGSGGGYGGGSGAGGLGTADPTSFYGPPGGNGVVFITYYPIQHPTIPQVTAVIT